jgi:hypothetical protein
MKPSPSPEEKPITEPDLVPHVYHPCANVDSVDKMSTGYRVPSKRSREKHDPQVPPRHKPLAMQVVGETRVPKGSREVVTLHAETTTPRRRKITDSYERQCTPTAAEPGELYPARRKRRKAESSARSRSLCRLDASKQGAYLSKEKARFAGRMYLPAWQVRELDAWKAAKEAEAITPACADREAEGWKRTKLGPRGWSDEGGWVWQTPLGRIVDLSRIVDYEGTEFYADWLWRHGSACGICACTG